MILKHAAFALTALCAVAAPKFVEGEKVFKISVHSLNNRQQFCVRALEDSYESWPYQQFQSKKETDCKIQILGEKGIVLDQAYCLLKEHLPGLAAQAAPAGISASSSCGELNTLGPGDNYWAILAFKFRKTARHVRFLYDGKLVAETEIPTWN